MAFTISFSLIVYLRTISFFFLAKSSFYYAIYFYYSMNFSQDASIRERRTILLKTTLLYDFYSSMTRWIMSWKWYTLLCCSALSFMNHTMACLALVYAPSSAMVCMQVRDYLTLFFIRIAGVCPRFFKANLNMICIRREPIRAYISFFRFSTRCLKCKARRWKVFIRVTWDITFWTFLLLICIYFKFSSISFSLARTISHLLAWKMRNLWFSSS